MCPHLLTILDGHRGQKSDLHMLRRRPESLKLNCLYSIPIAKPVLRPILQIANLLCCPHDKKLMPVPHVFIAIIINELKFNQIESLFRILYLPSLLFPCSIHVLRNNYHIYVTILVSEAFASRPWMIQIKRRIQVFVHQFL